MVTDYLRWHTVYTGVFTTWPRAFSGSDETSGQPDGPRPLNSTGRHGHFLKWTVDIICLVHDMRGVDGGGGVPMSHVDYKKW